MSEPIATVLNVDDNPDVLSLRSYLLRTAGFRVLEAVTGLEALRLAAAERPELALLDVSLPDLSGTEVCRRLKSAPETASTLVIQISSKFVRPSDRLAGLEAGADSYLIDPIEPEILIATLRSLLRLRQTLEQTRKQERTIDALLEYIPEGIAIADAPEFKIRRVSRYGLEMLRRSGMDLKASWAVSRTSEAVHSAVPVLPLTRVTENGEVVTNEECVLHKPDGSEITALCNAAPILDDDGTIAGAVIAWRDISELKRAQKALQGLNEFLVLTNRHTRMNPLLEDCAARIVALAGCSMAGVWIWGERGQVAYRDVAASTRTSLDVDWSNSRSPQELEQSIRGTCRQLGFDTVAFVPVQVGTRSLGVIHLADKDGSSPLQSEPMNVLRAAAGQLGAAVERVKAQVELQTAHDELEIRVRERTSELAALNQELDVERSRLFELLDGLPFYVCLHGEDYAVKFTNRRFREIFGDDSGRPCYSIMAGRSEPCVDCPALEVLRTNRPMERIWAAPDGRQYDVYHYPFGRGEGTRFVIELGADITERLRMEQAVQAERNKLKAILDAMPEGIYIANRSYEIEYINPYLEKEFGPVAGRKCYQYFHDLEDVCSFCPNERVFAGSDVHLEMAFEKTGKTYDLFDTPVVTLDGSMGKLEVFHDVTERKKSEEALRRSEEELRLLSAQLLSAQENERSRISRELHDELGQSMTLLKLRLGSIARKLPVEEIDPRVQCEGVLAYIDSMIENVRRLSRDLSPSILEDLGLTAALRRLVQDFGKATGIHVSIELDTIDGLLPRDRGIMLYRVVQEALTNIARHSGARTVRVCVKANTSTIEGSIADDGAGLAASVSAARADHGLGLTTMRERTRILGGTLELKSRPGEGTAVIFSIPTARQESVK